VNKQERDKLRDEAAARKIWHYQEESDAYTHIVRGQNEKYICAGPQGSKGEAEADARFAAGAPLAILALLDHIDALERDAERYHVIRTALVDDNSLENIAFNQFDNLPQTIEEFDMQCDIVIAIIASAQETK